MMMLGSSLTKELFNIAFLVVVSHSSPVLSNQALADLQNSLNSQLTNGGTFTLTNSPAIDGTLIISNKSNITFDGDNHTITQSSNLTTTIKIVNCTNVQVKNLTLIGDSNSYTGARNAAKGIYMRTCEGSHVITNVTFLDNGFAGFEGEATTNVVFDGCTFRADNVDIEYDDNYQFGIFAYGSQCDEWTVRNCHFEALGTGLCMGSFCDHAAIYGNTFTNMRGQHGIYLEASSYIEIYNNAFTEIAETAIKLQLAASTPADQQNIYIHSNSCINTTNCGVGVAGILVSKTSGSTNNVWWKTVFITNNIVENFSYGVNVGNVYYSQIRDNDLIDCGYGIFASQYSGSLVYNTIDNTEWSGIYAVVKTNWSCVIDGNYITNVVHCSSSEDSYKKCGIYISGVSTNVTVRNNKVGRGTGTPTYGLFQNSDIYFPKFYNNYLPLLVEIRGGYDPNPVYYYGNNFY